jgi:long-chain acyl-CoA synthetase
MPNLWWNAGPTSSPSSVRYRTLIGPRMQDHWQDYPVPHDAHRGLVSATAWCHCFTPTAPAVFMAMFAVRRGAIGQTGRRLLFEGQRWSDQQCHCRSWPAHGCGGFRRKASAKASGSSCLWTTGPSSSGYCWPCSAWAAIAVPVGVREQRPGLAYIARQCGASGHRDRRPPGRPRAGCTTRRPSAAPAHQRR